MIVYTDNVKNGTLTVRLTENAHISVLETDDGVRVVVRDDQNIETHVSVQGQPLDPEVI